MAKRAFRKSLPNPVASFPRPLAMPQPVLRRIECMRIDVVLALECGHTAAPTLLGGASLVREAYPCWECIKTKRRAPKRGKGKS